MALSSFSIGVDGIGVVVGDSVDVVVNSGEVIEVVGVGFDDAFGVGVGFDVAFDFGVGVRIDVSWASA